MSIMNTSQLVLIEKFLDLATVRQSLLVSNIANVDTPGYRTQDIDFHGELARALGQDPAAPLLPMVRQVPGLLSRPDGNNVSVDREAGGPAVDCRVRRGTVGRTGRAHRARRSQRSGS